MAEIRLRNLTKRWGDFVAVDTFDLDIADQEFLVLHGPSGCGKTTTAVNLAGALAARGDRVLLIDLDPQAHGRGCPER